MRASIRKRHRRFTGSAASNHGAGAAASSVMEDNRPASITQRVLIQSINNSPPPRSQSRISRAQRQAMAANPLQLKFLHAAKTARLHKASLKAFTPQGARALQFRGFGKFPPNTGLDPDKIGGTKGIRVIPAKHARPDDVPMRQDYRLAMHKLHDVVLVLENADRTPEKVESPNTEKLRARMVEIQSKAKSLAKDYKKAMRDLTSAKHVKTLQKTYNKGMNALIVELGNHAREGENVIKKHGYVKGGSSLKEKGTELWRERWLKTRKAVDSALSAMWGGWMGTLKGKAKSNKADKSPGSVWGKRVDGEKWNIFYGGSLMKGYKGPPKQGTRFLASHFDVDANMDAPAIARYLINVKHNKVDRGQLDPGNAPETGVKDMDKAMDKGVKDELVKAKVAPDTDTVEKIASEPFETRVNADMSIGGAAKKEVKRSTGEQEVRDRLTKVREKFPEKMRNLGEKLKVRGLLDDTTHGLVSRILTSREINTVNQLIDTT